MTDPKLRHTCNSNQRCVNKVNEGFDCVSNGPLGVCRLKYEIARVPIANSTQKRSGPLLFHGSVDSLTTFQLTWEECNDPDEVLTDLKFGIRRPCGQPPTVTQRPPNGEPFWENIDVPVNTKKHNGFCVQRSPAAVRDGRAKVLTAITAVEGHQGSCCAYGGDEDWCDLRDKMGSPFRSLSCSYSPTHVPPVKPQLRRRKKGSRRSCNHIEPPVLSPLVVAPLVASPRCTRRGSTSAPPFAAARPGHTQPGRCHGIKTAALQLATLRRSSASKLHRVLFAF